jgi:hypothetical protein
MALHLDCEPSLSLAGKVPEEAVTELASPRNELLSPCRAAAATLSSSMTGYLMELAGLEPATSWVRSTRSAHEKNVLLASYDFPGEHWIHLRTTNPIESTFATVRLWQRVTKGTRLAGRRDRDGVQTHRVGTAPLACRQFRPPRRAGQSRREARERRPRRTT